MNKPSLSQLFRDQTVADGSAPDADALLALARGERPADAERILAEMARSPLNGDLLRFARDLEPASTALSADLAEALDAGRAVHRGTEVSRRPNHGARRWRIGAALAASVLAAVAVWTAQRAPQRTTSPTAAAANAPALPDRIFAGLNEKAPAGRGDAIFRGDFRADGTFDSKGHDG